MEPHLPFKTRLQISIGTFAAKLCVRSDGTINRRLFSLLDQKVIAPTTKVFNDVPVSSSDISVDPSRNLWFRLFVPDTKSSAETLLPLIVYFHGEHRFPYSAGGNIAHHVTHRACKDSHQFKKIKIVGLLAMQPLFGGEERTASELRLTRVPFLNIESTDRMWRNFLPEGADRNHKAANVFRDGPNFKEADTVPEDFPSSLVFVAGFDPLQDWQKRYCEGLRRCGKEVWLVEYPNGIHGFYNFPELPESALIVKEVRQFIQEK
ncbi:unnamed protein product [Coffea canephora]|uniref:Alpha/beta hydrolase fold-3 domain-containing protein n=1 Tax=Coffea canephora TaxID=49390 RepID=A0A068USV4_COFCA|nr:unnamed protein product [Coffea canephora]